MNGLSGFALAGSLFGRAIDKKRAYGAVNTLNKERDASNQYQGAKSRTVDWLASLSPEELAKVSPESRNVASNFEGVGDVSNFDTDKRASELGLTSQHSGVEGIDEYLKAMSESDKRKKEETEKGKVTSALEDASRGMQRQNTFSDLNALEELAGMKKGDYNLQSPREIATSTGLMNYGDKPGVKEWLKTNIEDPEKLEYKKTSKVDTEVDPEALQFGNRAGLVSWFNKPEKVKETLEQLEYFKNNFNLPESEYEILRQQAQTGQSYDVREYMTDAITGKQKNKIREDLEYGLIDPRSVTKAATTAAGIKARKEEGEILSETAAERLGDFDASISQMDELLNGLNNPDAPQGPIAQWKKINPYDWQAQGKEQLAAATKQLVGKALEGGVLRKEDEDKYAKILPTTGDTYKSAVLKTKQLVAMLNNTYTAKRTALKNAGYDVNKFSEGVKVGAKKPKTNPVDSALGKVPQEDIDLAKEALNDPDAPLAVKANARLVLRNAGVK